MTAPAPDVAAVFDAFPDPVRVRLLEIRSLVFDTAARTPEIGPLTETLKWGEPAYLTEQTRSGSTLRLGRPTGVEDHCALFVNCQTRLIDTFRARVPDLSYQGNRAVLVPVAEPLREPELATCIALTLTYHLWKT